MTRTLTVMPTGTGKTVLFAFVAKHWADHRLGRVLVMAHREELIFQARDKIEQVTGELPDIEMADSRADQGGFHGRSNVVITSVQTMCRESRHCRFDPNDFTLLIIDEAHHATAASYRKVIEHFSKNPNLRILGVTATPDRADEQALGQIFETVAFEYSIQDAINDGWLVPIEQQFVMVEGLDLSAVRTTAGDLNEGDLARILELEENLHGIVDPTIELAGDTPTLVFASSVEHAERMAEIFNRHRSESAICLHGKTPREERRDKIRAFSRGEYQFMCNCLDEETEILTTRGWVGIDDISESDVTAAMCINGTCERLAWEPLRALVKRDRAPGERMVSIRNQTLNARVTEGHRMVVRSPGARKWKIVEAGQLPGHKGTYQFPLAPGWALHSNHPSQPTTGHTTSIDRLTVDECRFLGLWISDGHLDRTAGHRGVTIGQSDRYKEANLEIKSILTGCGFDWRMRSVKTDRSPFLQHTYSVPKGSIGGKLSRQGFWRLSEYLDKSFHPSLLGLRRDKAKAIINGVWLGDGDKDVPRNRTGERSSWRISNTNKLLLDRLQILAVVNGYSANLSGPINNGPLSTKPIYRLTIRRRRTLRTNNRFVHTSGGNPATFEPDWKPERVWCVTNKSGTIITRRYGKVMVMGQCGLFLEGFDETSIGVVAMARPTKSRALYAQAVGRGTRPLPGIVDGLEDAEQRRRAIGLSRKPGVLVLDFVGNSGRHKLVSTADILGGNYDDEVVELAGNLARKKSARGEKSDMLAELKTAQEQIEAEAKRKRAAVVAKAKFRAQSVNPFDVFDLQPKREAGWHKGRKPTDKQIATLEKFKVPPKEIDGLSFTAANQLLDTLIGRMKQGKCTYKQASLLRKHGYSPDTSMAEASRIIDALAKNNWKRPAELV